MKLPISKQTFCSRFYIAIDFYNPFLSSMPCLSANVKTSILKYEETLEKNSNARRAYESVDDESLS